MVRKKEKGVSEFGDFQTPDDLATEATCVIQRLGLIPQTVIEPTCGRGAFLVAAMRAFPQAATFVGVEINKTHLDSLKKRLNPEVAFPSTTLKHADFFSVNWSEMLGDLPQPILVIGNPPWVTSSELGSLDSSNLPDKSNFQGHRGLDAITGKSNFDISEWMILQYLEWLKGRDGYIAVLCKTAVARKVLNHAWKHSAKLASSQIYLIDAPKYFNASVDACFFVMGLADSGSQNCDIYGSLREKKPIQRIGYRDGLVVANVEKHKKLKHLAGQDSNYIWRSGIKHDCAKVLELDKIDTGFCNGYGEIAALETAHIYPLCKSSDVSNSSHQRHRKYLLVTQHCIGEETAHIQQDAPVTWQYLNSHESSFAKRKSVIYRNRPRFSMFGVGDYTFAPWKVAISGFYKNLNFKCIGPLKQRPVVFDDTVYFLSCWSKEEAQFLTDILNSEPAREFLDSMIFWSEKRPITAGLLRRLNLKALSLALGRESEYRAYTHQRAATYDMRMPRQISLGIAEKAMPYQKAATNRPRRLA